MQVLTVTLAAQPTQISVGDQVKFSGKVSALLFPSPFAEVAVNAAGTPLETVKTDASGHFQVSHAFASPGTYALVAHAKAGPLSGDSAPVQVVVSAPVEPSLTYGAPPPEPSPSPAPSPAPAPSPTPAPAPAGGGTAPSQGSPRAPSNVAARAVSSNEVDVEWTNDPAQTRLVIDRSADPNFTYDLNRVNVDPTSTRYADQTVSSGTTYYYRLYAGNDSGASPPSNIVSATTPTY